MLKDIIARLSTIGGAQQLAYLLNISLLLLVLVTHFHINPKSTASHLFNKGVYNIGKKIKQSEINYRRKLEIGKLNKKALTVRFYNLLNDLTIDLQLKQKGTTPYELLFFILVMTFILSFFSAFLLFGSVFMGMLLFGPVFVGFVCALYTKGNMAHEDRINAVIEAENIICNNIESGVKVAVRNSIDSFPKSVQVEFRDFLHELDDSTYIATALINLNDRLGTIADKFISKCIKFELFEEHGTAGTFKDIVEMNTYKTQTRIRMARAFEQVMSEFKICAGMIIIFLGLVLLIYPFVRNLYFNTLIGNLILVADVLLFISEFVIITYLRAQDFEHTND